MAKNEEEEPQEKQQEKIATEVMFVAFDKIGAAGGHPLNIPDDVRRELRVKATEFASLLLQHLPQIVGQRDRH
ncbi:MAG: hypothetical protein Q8P07_01130 [bacterium]|nr:hypothetical protein [bacterium]